MTKRGRLCRCIPAELRKPIIRKRTTSARDAETEERRISKIRLVRLSSLAKLYGAHGADRWQALALALAAELYGGFRIFDERASRRGKDHPYFALAVEVHRRIMQGEVSVLAITECGKWFGQSPEALKARFYEMQNTASDEELGDVVLEAMQLHGKRK